jgi:hypothetical protein
MTVHRSLFLTLLIGLLLLTTGCGPSKREQTLSTLNTVADSWDGGPDFKTDATDAWGKELTAKVNKGLLHYDLELRSSGADGLPKNSDDVVVHRHKRHGETTVNQELERGSESVGRGGARGIIQGVKEAVTGKDKAAAPKKN